MAHASVIAWGPSEERSLVSEIVSGSVIQTDETLAPRGEAPRSDASYAGHFAAVALCRSLAEGTSPHPPFHHLHMQRRCG